MSLYTEFIDFLKKQGRGPRPKRKGEYTPRVQIVGKTDERTQLRVLCLAYENGMSAGELIDLLCHELVEDQALLNRCIKRRKSSDWMPRNKYGQYEDWNIYRQRKKRSADDQRATDEIVNHPIATPTPGSIEETQCEKLKELGRARRVHTRKAAKPPKSARAPAQRTVAPLNESLPSHPSCFRRKRCRQAGQCYWTAHCRWASLSLCLY